MKECWPEGALRAYLDRELPPEEMARIAGHLEVCSECGDHWSELAGRAARVSSLMEELATPGRKMTLERPVRKAAVARWKWAGAAAALAAGVLLGLAFLPKPQPVVVAVPPPALVVTRPPVAQPEPAAEAPAPRIMNAVARPERPRRPGPVRRPLSPDRQPDDFISLDDEPISTGVVLRVELGPRAIPADVIFGPDGRPHAIRLVNDDSKQRGEAK